MDCLLDCLPPLLRPTEPEVAEVEPLLVRRPRLPEQEVLGLDVAVHVALEVEVLEDAERLQGDARDHLLAHDLPLAVPDVP